jgi:hypothetical protein
MTIRITQANISGFTADSEMLPEDPEEAQFFIPSAFEALDNFSIDLIVEGVFPDPMDPEGVIYEYATNVRSSVDWEAIGITYSKPNPYTVRLAGPATNIFIDQFYRFKMTDYSEKVLPANTEERFFGLIQYQMPNPTFIMKTFLFDADFSDNPLDLQTEQFSMYQWFFWRYEVAEANITAIMERGLK